ncbi:unnamed protein product [Peronospora effusa]|nr:unnamed protein product [Peronospora effusa]
MSAECYMASVPVSSSRDFLSGLTTEADDRDSITCAANVHNTLDSRLESPGGRHERLERTDAQWNTDSPRFEAEAAIAARYSLGCNDSKDKDKDKDEVEVQALSRRDNKGSVQKD